MGLGGASGDSPFTTPHYAASLSAYQAMRERFPVRYERVTYFPGEGAGRDPDYASPPFDQLFPFETVDARGDFIVPENLGYISNRRAAGPFGRRPSDLVASARRNLVVRDGYASFFYHWYEDPEQLRGIVRSLKSLGYTFVSPDRVAEDAPASIRPELPVHQPTTLQRLSRRLRIGGDRCQLGYPMAEAATRPRP